MRCRQAYRRRSSAVTHRRGQTAWLVPVLTALALTRAQASWLGPAGGHAAVWPAGAPAGLLAAAPAPPPRVAVGAHSAEHVTIELTIDALDVREVTRPEGNFTLLNLPQCGASAVIGAPRLPVIRRSLVVPDGVDVRVTWSGTASTNTLAALGLAAPLAPLQRPIPKVPGARAARAFDWDRAAYANDVFAPATPVTVVEGGRFAGRRLVVLEVAPCAYNPVQTTLITLARLTVTLTWHGGRAATAPLSPREATLLGQIALNTAAPATAMAAPGRLLIISAPELQPALAPFAEHKAALGWSVDLTNTTVGVSTNVIRDFVRARYADMTTRPDAVLLVGDVDSVPQFVSREEDYPDTDLYYGCMDEGDDWLPELPVGRFSATNAAQVAAILAKTMAYETTAHGAWTKRAAFIASSDFAAITEATHDWTIAAHMASNGFACDRLYSKTCTATPARVIAAFNDGRLLGIYSGHGKPTNWFDPPFFQHTVNSLTNYGQYPIICSFACWTGAYGNPAIAECFAETWLRAADAGAVLVWASSVYSYWDEDDALQRALFEALFTEHTWAFGAAAMRAKYRYRDMYPVSGPSGATVTTRRYFEMYNIFGDPTLELLQRHNAMLSTAPSPIRPGAALTLTLADADMTAAAPCSVAVRTSVGDAEDILLVPAAAGLGLLTQSITVVAGTPLPGDGVIQAAHQVVISNRVIDTHTSQGIIVTTYALAHVDAQAPAIAQVAITNLTDTSATILWRTDEPARGAFLWASATQAVVTTALSVTHRVDLVGLAPLTPHAFVLAATDIAGLTSTNDNAGQFFAFTTKLFLPAWQNNAGDSAQDEWATNLGWHASTLRPLAGAHSWYCGDEASQLYTNNAVAILETPALAITSPETYLRFTEYVATWVLSDYCYVRISTNAGATWGTLRSVAGRYNTRAVELPLGAYATKTVRLRFHFVSDNSVVLEGWYLDDIRVGTLAVPEGGALWLLPMMLLFLHHARGSLT
jgi:hypothetical protein